MEQNNNDGAEKGPLSAFEIRNLRRMLADYTYQRRIRRTVKIWAFTFGGIASVMAAMLSVWKELISRLGK